MSIGGQIALEDEILRPFERSWFLGPLRSILGYGRARKETLPSWVYSFLDYLK